MATASMQWHLANTKKVCRGVIMIISLTFWCRKSPQIRISILTGQLVFYSWSLKNVWKPILYFAWNATQGNEYWKKTCWSVDRAVVKLGGCYKVNNEFSGNTSSWWEPILLGIRHILIINMFSLCSLSLSLQPDNKGWIILTLHQHCNLKRIAEQNENAVIIVCLLYTSSASWGVNLSPRVPTPSSVCLSSLCFLQ